MDILNALPDHCWHSVQWQAYVSSGIAVTSNRTAPQGQPPLIGNTGRSIGMIGMLL
jgi:hypothetical protein